MIKLGFKHTKVPVRTPVWSEEERLAALQSYHILDTVPEEDFDDIARLAAQICDVPVSLISFVDRDRQWFKSSIGTDMRQTGLDVSFCKYTLLEEEALIVPDATKDARFKNNVLVTDNPKIRFYAGAMLRTPQGLPLGTVCVVDTKPREITEEQSAALKILARQAMKLLELRRIARQKQISDERLHFALDTTAIIGTWDWDLQADIIYSDPRFAKMFSIDATRAEEGVPSAEFVKSMHPDDVARIEGKVKIAIATGGAFAEEHRIIAEDGTIRWIYAHGQVFFDDNGKALRFPGAAVDITEKKRMERKRQAIVDLNERLPGLHTTGEVGMLAAGILGATLSGIRAGYGKLNETGDIITIERDWTDGMHNSISGVHYFKDYGHELAESVKRGDVIVINDVLEDARTKDMADNFAALNVRSLINVSIVEDGNVSALFYIHSDIARQWRQGEIQLVQDIAQRTWAAAERIRAEEQMKIALKKAESANLAKTEFLANMSHEIRTPMNAIIGLSSILATEALTPKQKEFVRTLLSSAESLMSLINDLLDISKIEARTIELEHIPFNLMQLIEEVISMVNVKAREKGLKVTMDYGCVKDRAYTGDPTRLRQILINLCSNAIKFTEKGTIGLTVTCHPGVAPHSDHIDIAIKDTGIGIPADKMEYIFEKFSQADTSINRKYGGTGLGLAITRTLAKVLGGDVTVQSELGQGSVFTFSVELPIADEKDIELDFIKTLQDAGQLEENNMNKILLVEDYAPNVLVAGTFLEEFGFEWDSAKSGTEAVEKVMSGNYAAILMDVQMFGMNGLEATRAIREFEKKNNLKHVPIIGMTAHALSGDREKCINAGMDDYISKPFNPEELQRKLQHLIV